MSKFDTTLTTFVLLVYIGAFTPSKYQEGIGVGADPAGKIGVFLLSLAAPLIAILLIRNRERVLKTLRLVTWPLFLLALIFLSTLWSVNPGTTLRRALIFSVSTGFAIHLASLESELRERLFGTGVVVTIIFSFIVAIFFPAYGISGGNHLGEWRGVFEHKNIMGRQMVFSFFLALYSQAFRSRTVARTVAALALLLLLLSRSGTGIAGFGFVLVFAALLAIHTYLTKRESESGFWIFVVPAFLILAAIAFGLRSEVLALLGKDESLTGRTTIWAVVWQGIDKRPVLGWGYDAFYTQRELGEAFAKVGLPNHSHNGFFDVILAAGFVGLTVFVIGYLVAFRNAWKIYRKSLTLSSQWPLLFLVMFIFLNLTESNLLRRGTFMWIPYVSLALWGMRKEFATSTPSMAAVRKRPAIESVSA